MIDIMDRINEREGTRMGSDEILSQPCPCVSPPAPVLIALGIRYEDLTQTAERCGPPSHRFGVSEAVLDPDLSSASVLSVPAPPFDLSSTPGVHGIMAMEVTEEELCPVQQFDRFLLFHIISTYLTCVVFQPWSNGAMEVAEEDEELPYLVTREDNTTEWKLPIDMVFNSGNVVSIVTYSILLIISSVGNITVLIILRRKKTKRSRINLLLMHLAIADLFVTLLMMPLEIGWNFTVAWTASDALCRVMAFFRIFGLYLSSFVLVCISIDRYYAVLKPMALHGVDRRARIMLSVAWVLSIIFSTPQCSTTTAGDILVHQHGAELRQPAFPTTRKIVLFHVEPHSKVSWYVQCVTFHSFPSKAQELAYLVFGMAMMYGIPLLVIIFTYVSILLEIYRRSRQTTTDTFRRSSLGYLGKAKVRTLKMTIIIVLVFIICWTPYYIMCVWYWSDTKSAKKVDQWIQKFLFIFASTNSCMNPIVYGAFNIRRRGAAVSGTTTEGQVRDRLSTFSSTGADHRPSSSIRLVHFHSLQLIKTG
uniref:G-protein coupled receptors family 1 profile domain-containing protein n=1 Tax=Timema poppense TaxID=170557 RepID=A0A7R9CT88_TIMPO|nr:unnamed protein product [Timema poppensis]